MVGQVINRREQQKQHTRVALEDAALRLFAHNGYEQTTVEEIAAAAGVSMRTFFRYFSSKQHVLFGDVAHHRVGLLRAALQSRPVGEDPLDSVRIVLDESDITDPDELAQIRARLQLLFDQPQLIGTYLTVSHELRQLICEFVAQRCGLPPVHPYPLLVSAAAQAAWDAALWAWAAGVDGDLSRLRRAGFAELTMGIRPPA